MNEGSESSAELPPEQALLVEACKSYLDVIHAINAFQTRVCHMGCDVIEAARDRISRTAALANPLRTPVNTYIYPPGADNNFDGSEAWVGAKIRLDGPLWADLYLTLVFHYDPNGNQQTPHVCFALEVWQRNALNQLGNIFGRHQYCTIHNDWEWLAVELRWPLGDPLRVREELTTMLDNALTWWDHNSNNVTANGESA